MLGSSRGLSAGICRVNLAKLTAVGGNFMDLVGKRKLQHYGTLLQSLKDVSPWVIMAQFCVAVHQKVNTALNLTLPAALWSKALLALAKGNGSTRHLTPFLATKSMASSKSLD